MSPIDNQHIEKSEFNIKTVAAVVMTVISLMAWMYGNIVIPLTELKASQNELKVSTTVANNNFNARVTKLESKVFPSQ